MISGVVNGYNEAVIRLFIRGANLASGTLHEIEAVVDMGFDEHLSLPADLIALLELPYFTDQQIMLADGRIETCAVFDATVLWDGSDRDILVQSAVGTPLVGMAMLYRHDVAMHIDVGGSVTITPFAN